MLDLFVLTEYAYILGYWKQMNDKSLFTCLCHKKQEPCKGVAATSSMRKAEKLFWGKKILKTSKVESFPAVVNGFQRLTAVAKLSTVDVCGFLSLLLNSQKKNFSMYQNLSIPFP